MIWSKLKNIIKRKFSKSNKNNKLDNNDANVKKDKSVKLDKLVENLEKQRLENATLPFKIISLKDNGFVVKVSELYAFVSFYYMPWEYVNTNCWIAVAPKLIGKVFYCKIHDIQKKPTSLLIIVNGKIPQFKRIKLKVRREYRGVIIKKLNFGILVDIGCHFRWNRGSFVGLLHASQFDSTRLFANCSEGDEIRVCYQGLNEKGQMLFCQNGEIFDWNNRIPQGFVGQTVLVAVVREHEEEEPSFLVDGKYTGKIAYEKNDCFFGSTTRIVDAKYRLKDGDIIHCKVTGFNSRKRTLKLNWITELDLGIVEVEKYVSDESG